MFAGRKGTRAKSHVDAFVEKSHRIGARLEEYLDLWKACAVTGDCGGDPLEHEEVGGGDDEFSFGGVGVRRCPGFGNFPGGQKWSDLIEEFLAGAREADGASCAVKKSNAKEPFQGGDTFTDRAAREAEDLGSFAERTQPGDDLKDDSEREALECAGVICRLDHCSQYRTVYAKMLSRQSETEILGSVFEKEAEMTNNTPTSPDPRTRVVALLESLENGDPGPASFIDPAKYIQHNLGVADGLEGFGAILANAPPGGFKAKVVRAFQDGDFVFTHTEYDFFGPKVGFDVLRFEDGLIVEHWDNLADIAPPNGSGRTQLDGTSEVQDLDKTEENKALVKGFVEAVLVKGDMSGLADYFAGDAYLQHNPGVEDGLSGLGRALAAMAEQGISMEYTTIHRVLGEGNFVLCMSEGSFAGTHSAYYDLFRVESGKIAEHWDVIEPIPAREEWANENGKF